MPEHGHFGPKPPPEQSHKDHVPLPEKDTMPHEKPPEDTRGGFGQFTDRGSPGNQRK